MAAIFLSYSRHNEAAARSLGSDLAALGHTVWLDLELSGGQVWWDQILGQIRRCDVLVLALAPEALASTACTREYHYAADLGKPIVPVVVADGISTALLPPTLSKVQLVAYHEPDRAAAIRLARALAAAPPAGPLPEPLPAPPDVPMSYLGHLTERIDSTGALSFDEQSALLVDLRRATLDDATRADARTLLLRLRRRRDLFAAVADQIDEVLGRDVPRERPLPLVDTPRPRNDAKTPRDAATPGRSPAILRGVALALLGPLGWMVALRKDRQSMLAVLSGSLGLFFVAALLAAQGDGIDGYDDDIWEYLAYTCLAVMWWGPFAMGSLRAKALVGDRRG